jgi:hypothetical protein
VDAKVVEDGQVVIGHRGGSDAVATDRGLSVPSLVEGDDLAAEVEQGIPHDGPTRSATDRTRAQAPPGDPHPHSPPESECHRGRPRLTSPPTGSCRNLSMGYRSAGAGSKPARDRATPYAAPPKPAAISDLRTRVTLVERNTQVNFQAPTACGRHDEGRTLVVMLTDVSHRRRDRPMGIGGRGGGRPADLIARRPPIPHHRPAPPGPVPARRRAPQRCRSARRGRPAEAAGAPAGGRIGAPGPEIRVRFRLP